MIAEFIKCDIVMKKVLFIIFSLILLIGCKEENQTTNEQSNNIQYHSTFNSGRETATDIRIITLTKDGRTHDYVVANNISGRAGGIAIEH